LKYKAKYDDKLKIMDNLNQQKQNAACIELCGPSRDSSVAPKKNASFLKGGKAPIFGVFQQARYA
jgi:hypothetical protein